jgi:hypothetical protein
LSSSAFYKQRRIRFYKGFRLFLFTRLFRSYDMCKAVDRGMVIREVKLLEKSGGKSGTWVAEK